ncbi:unnamed protein product [Nippostrongylus brasiliensis]|uniref:EGF-like domain-containing protein n=1 Tax=Nippostrongylus brasiliensis TaxID=27835 RepID=A0A0N4YH47_NIPBR|nr:unnamed protein product [Nippostrongylus brasiliensis]
MHGRLVLYDHRRRVEWLVSRLPIGSGKHFLCSISVACGGLTALGSCTNGACSNGVCTASNYCCECPVGRSGGRCNNGICPSGFTCQNGFCCPQCPNNVMPFGTCRNGACGGGTTCRAGNICC